MTWPMKATIDPHFGEKGGSSLFLEADAEQLERSLNLKITKMSIFRFFRDPMSEIEFPARRFPTCGGLLGSESELTALS